MLSTRVNLELLDDLVSQLVLGQHPSNCVIEQIFRLAFKSITVAFQSQSWMASVPREVTRLHFATRHRDLFGIGDDDEIATITMRCVFRLVFAHQNHRNIARKSSENLVRCVHDVPLFWDLAWLGHKSSLSHHGKRLGLLSEIWKPLAFFAARNEGIYRSGARTARPFGRFTPAFSTQARAGSVERPKPMQILL
jgi:hypothetical protein